MLRFVALVFLLVGLIRDAPAQSPRLLQKPVAEYRAVESEGPDSAIVRADLSPDGKLVVCFRRGGQFTVYAVGDSKPRSTGKSAGEPLLPYGKWVDFSPDGKLLAFPGRGKRVEIVSTQTGKPHSSIELPQERRVTAQDVTAVAFSPDGRTLAVSSGVLYHMDLHLFDVATGKLLGQPLQNVDSIAYQLLYSADGKRLVANFWSTIYLIDVEAHRVIAKLPASAHAVFFQGEKLFAIQEALLTVHEVTDDGVAKQAVGQLVQKSDNISLMGFVRNGLPIIAAIVLKNEISIRDLEGRELFRVAGASSRIERISMSKDGRVLLLYHESQLVEVFRLE